MNLFDRRRPAALMATLASLALVGALAACGGDAQAGSGSAVKLKIGFQTAEFPELLEASGLFEDTDYDFDVPIINGPANQLAALYGKQIDIGWTGDNTGAFEAANSTTDWATNPPLQGIAVAYTPGAPHPAPAIFASTKSGIKTLADLKGRKIGYNVGGNIYAGYVVALEKGGLTPETVEGVQFPANQAAASAFINGDLDAVVSSYTLVKKGIDSGEVVQIGDPESLGIIGGGGWIARTDVIKDPAKLPAIKDFYGRLRTFYEEWIPAHETEYEAILAKTLNQTPDVAKVNWENAAHTTFYPVGDPEFTKIQQTIVDAAFKVGGLKTDADAALGYDPVLDEITAGKK